MTEQVISKELMLKLSNLDDKELKKFLALVEHKRKEDDMRQLEYDYLKEKSALKEVPFRSSTPEGEMVTNLDDTNYIDQNTRLTGTEINALFRYDTLVKMGVYPPIPMSNIYKKLKISEAGKGRGEKVSIVTGARQQRNENAGFWQKLFQTRKMEVENDGNKQQ